MSVKSCLLKFNQDGDLFEYTGLCAAEVAAFHS